MDGISLIGAVSVFSAALCIAIGGISAGLGGGQWFKGDGKTS